MYEFGSSQQVAQLTLYTDAFVIRGSIATMQRRISDILNQAHDPFLVLSGVTVDEFGPHGSTSTAEHAQINLASVLFAVADTSVDTVPELRTPKIPEIAMIAIPPFRVTGSIHLLPERDLGAALARAPWIIRAGDRRDLLVGCAGRGADHGRPGGRQSRTGADPGAPSRHRSVGGHGPVAR